MRFASTVQDYISLLLCGSPSRAERCVLATAILSAIASGVPFPLIGIYFGQLLNDFNSVTCLHSESSSAQVDSATADYQASVNTNVLMIVYLAIGQFVLIYTHLTAWSLYGSRLAQRLREDYLQKLLRREPWYFDGLPVGEVASRLSADIQAIRAGTSEKVGIVLSAASFFVTAYVVAFVKNRDLAAMLVSLVPAYFAMSLVGSHYIEKYSGTMADHAARAAAVASEALSNLVVVQAFSANKRLEESFTVSLDLSKQDGLKRAAAVGIQSGLLYFISYSANGLAFWQGSKQIAVAVGQDSGGMTVGSIFTVIFILVEATLMLSQVAPFIHLFSVAVASFRKLRDELGRESLLDGTSSSGVVLAEPQAGIELKNVSFRYPSRPEVVVLDGINLTIPLHKHTAIVGASGSGKSTVAALIARLYVPAGGSVTFSGHNIQDLNVRRLRGLIGLVQQDPSLLDRSLLENIAHGLVNSVNIDHAHLQATILGPELGQLAGEVRKGKNLTAAAEALGNPHLVEIAAMVQKAATLADANGFISRLQHGYGTVAGITGRLLSGGQKQRVALARALVKEPHVLVLDEATSALDSGSEDRIQQAMAGMASDSGRTILTIAHRLSTVTHADNIIVMDKGRVVEEGNHTTLMTKNGAYADLVRIQNIGSDASLDDDKAESIESASIFEPHTTSAHHPRQPEKSLASSAVVPVHEAEDAEAETEEARETPRKSLWALAKGYAPAVRPHLLVVAMALLGSTLVGGAFSGEAVIFGNTVGRLNECKTAASIRAGGRFFGLMFLVLAVIELLANAASWTGFGWVAEQVVFSVRVLSFRSLMEQDLHWHQDKGRSPASLLSYVTRDGEALAAVSGSVIGTLFSITVNLVAAIVLTHIISWRIALVCLALVPLLLGAGLVELRILGRFEERHEGAYASSVAIATEAVACIRTVAALSLEDETLATYRRSLVGPRRETVRVSLQASFCQALTYFFGNCVNALAYWYGARQIIAGNVSTTEFLIVVFSLLVSALLWSQMFALAPELSNARGAMARILALIEIGSEKLPGKRLKPSDSESSPETEVMAAGASGEKVPSYQGSDIQFRDVHFAYPTRPDARVLQGLNLSIRPGTFSALVGPSGAGKSTIISLLTRLYKPSSGSILIDGVDVARTDSLSFRDGIALVPQESTLFSGTIAFNVWLGARADRGHAPDLDEVREACQLANIHGFIETLPDGYDTLCGPDGMHFSGGQRQRLAIARALVRKPRLLLLDEPTSALDAESEKVLQHGLEKAGRGITVIAIAHRLSTIRKADCIFLIDNGRCVDSGTHTDLLQRSESYCANVRRQTIAD